MAVVSLKPSSKGLTVLIVVAAVILFACALGYMGAAGKIGAATTEMQKKEKQVAASKQIAQKLERSKLDYLDARSQVRYLESSVSTQDFVPTLLNQIEHLGKSVNLKVLGVRPAPIQQDAKARSLSSGAKASEGNIEDASQEKNASIGSAKAKAPAAAPYDEIKIDIEAQGKYMNALDFIYKLTSFPKIIAVNTVEMSPPGNNVGVISSPILSIKLNVTAFVLKQDDKAAPKIDKTPASSTVTKRQGRTDNEAG